MGAISEFEERIHMLRKECTIFRFRGTHRLPVLVTIVFLCACAGSEPISMTRPTLPTRPPEPPSAGLPLLGYTIQAGAFSSIDNAARFTDLLQQRGLDAFYFVDRDGLYKVRFGDFPAKADAVDQAGRLIAEGVIEAYYIVRPEDYAAFGKKTFGADFLREKLVETAKGFMGLPYLWGGASPETGFDCSGLTMTAYRLCGLNLPRTSRDQFKAGTEVDPENLSRGDLVFFGARKSGQVTHVGVYIGRSSFIHAPGKGKPVRVDRISDGYYNRRFIGGRTYL